MLFSKLHGPTKTWLNPAADSALTLSTPPYTIWLVAAMSVIVSFPFLIAGWLMTQTTSDSWTWRARLSPVIFRIALVLSFVLTIGGQVFLLLRVRRNPVIGIPLHILCAVVGLIITIGLAQHFGALADRVAPRGLRRRITAAIWRLFILVTVLVFLVDLVPPNLRDVARTNSQAHAHEAVFLIVAVLLALALVVYLVSLLVYAILWPLRLYQLSRALARRRFHPAEPLRPSLPPLNQPA